jgi:hypothetical protein
MNKELKEFAAIVSDMRKAQKGYFSAVPNTPEKREYLDKSKRLEAKVDELTAKILSNQTNLF